jgi:long-subunit fatty acid transport protein
MHKSLSLAILMSVLTLVARAQTSYGDLDEFNTITTAVPFLTISPDARAGAMGDVGVSTLPDGASNHWNPAKFAFIGEGNGLSLSYTPWMSRLVPDISLAYISYYQSIGKRQTIATSLRYFSLGNITFRDDQGNYIGQFNPNEFAFDVSYALQLSDNLSAGVALRYIYSNLTGGQFVQGFQTRPGMSAAADLSVFYLSDQFKAGDMKAKWSWGMCISNIGAKISYTESGNRDFLPANMRVGAGGFFEIDKYNKFNVHLELNKLLVPTPPQYEKDSTGQIVFNPDGTAKIAAGKDPNVPVIQGVFQSFSDAPGGIKEEMQEIAISLGGEYWYNDQFAVRAGYFHEHESKGNRKYFTMGAGFKMNVFALDVAYLIPATKTVKSPLENTLRFTMTFDLQNLFAGEEIPK